jgi:Bifunctional DNA primase/polymerase, N-terminal
MSSVAVALAYLQAGLSLLPVATDGTKAPAWSLLPKAWDDRQGREKATWKPYQTQPPTPDEVQAWYSHQVGLGIIAGRVSGNLEVLDFDARELFAPWCDMVDELAPGLVQRLPVVKTPSNGRHSYYRCETIAGNQKLAKRLETNGAVQTLIETRGEGGYVIAPISPAACHPLKKPYELLDGDLADIPRITLDERTILLNAARSFNEYVEPERTISHQAKEHMASTNGDRPGDVFNVRVGWSEILEPHGWTRVGQRGEVMLWKRPSKQERGWSATTGYGTDLLYIFSTNAAPF